MNKFDRPGAEDALAEIRKQVKRNREDWDASNESLPVVPTIASQFADAGVDQLWHRLVGLLNSRMNTVFVASEPNLGDDGLPKRNAPIPPERQGYLAEVASTVREYHSSAQGIAEKVRLVQQLSSSSERMKEIGKLRTATDLANEAQSLRNEIPENVWQALNDFDEYAKAYRSGQTSYTVRGKEIPVDTTSSTLSGIQMPKVALPEQKTEESYSNGLRKKIDQVHSLHWRSFPIQKKDRRSQFECLQEKVVLSFT